MECELIVNGAIIDSWVERRGMKDGPRVVLQIAPRHNPSDLMIVEAKPGLIPDRAWLDDLSENMCHGSPVSAVGRMTRGGSIAATRILLAR